MKKTLAILLAALLAVSFLASCAGGGAKDSYSGQTSTGTTGAFDGGAMPSSAPAPMPEEDFAYDMAAGEDASYSKAESEFRDGMPGLQKPSVNMSEKIIYSVSADIETIDFDTTINTVNEMLDGFGAFVENSYVGGRSYRQAYGDYQAYRTAWYTLRVPSEALAAMSDSLSDLGSVTSLQRGAENITTQFIDTESRLKSYRTQEERLLSLMEKAETVEDLLTIEQYLAEVRYQIEALTSQLNNWQSRIDYSVVTLNISEVEEYSELPPEKPLTYWEQVRSELGKTIRGIGGFFKSLFKWLIASSPVLAILAVIIVAIVVIVTKRRRAASKNVPPDER